ncbi:hypothetical protein KJ671_02480 [Patescibacteria group bacterium]|nr:hypothetical protein [Patescibacteria group bacterium]
MKMKIYFGHPINTYNTGLEAELLKKIGWFFPDWEIENPNQKHHSEGYKKHSMGYFLEKVIPKCKAGIFLPFRDGKLGIGVFKEARSLYKLHCPIYIITFKGLIQKLKLSETDVLTIEETRTRIRDSKGRSLPY